MQEIYYLHNNPKHELCIIIPSMSKLPITLMIEIVQISVKDNIKCSSYKVEPLKRTPTRRVLETRRQR